MSTGDVKRMLIRVLWSEVRSNDDERWSYTCCLYAYVAAKGREILYIGKCDGCTVRQRWRNKYSFWQDLERNRNIWSHRVLIGELLIPRESRLTRQLLADAESLLIWRTKPWGNIQCQNDRIRRVGLSLRCSGAWPLTERSFVDSLS